MNATFYEFVCAFGGAFVAAFGSLLLLRPRRASIYSDSAVALSKAYSQQIDGLLKDVGRLDGEMTAMRTERAALLLELASSRDENGQLRRRVTELEDQVRKLTQR